MGRVSQRGNFSLKPFALFRLVNSVKQCGIGRRCDIDLDGKSESFVFVVAVHVLQLQPRELHSPVSKI